MTTTSPIAKLAAEISRNSDVASETTTRLRKRVQDLETVVAGAMRVFYPGITRSDEWVEGKETMYLSLEKWGADYNLVIHRRLTKEDGWKFSRFSESSIDAIIAALPQLPALLKQFNSRLIDQNNRAAAALSIADALFDDLTTKKVSDQKFANNLKELANAIQATSTKAGR